MAHLQSWEVNAGCWQEALFHTLTNFSKELLKCPHDKAADFLQSERYMRESKAEAAMFFIT